MIQVLALGLLISLAAGRQPVDANRSASATAPAGRSANTRYVCVPSLVWSSPELCPNYGPATTARRHDTIRLPDPLPELRATDPVAEDPADGPIAEEILPHTYGHVTALPLSVYRHPMEAIEGLPPVRVMLSGDWWLSIDRTVEYGGQLWLQINDDEFVAAESVALASPSRFRGLLLVEQPQYPFAWINRSAQPSETPQGAADGDPLSRYQVVTIFAEARRGEELWYLVGPDQWVEQSNTSRVDVDPPPEGVGPEDKWVEVDLFEQTIAAYQGSRMVYATLISGGREGDETPAGLYRLWVKILEGKMSHPDVEDGDPAFYYIEDVPWTVYFHEGYSIHASFWHDAFGFRRSHGCVNVSPLDARWFYEWTDPPVPDGEDEWLVLDGMPNTWVWVHFDSPLADRIDGDTQLR
jgi:hypothetical protein